MSRRASRRWFCVLCAGLRPKLDTAVLVASKRTVFGQSRYVATDF